MRHTVDSGLPWWREDLPTIGRWVGVVIIVSAAALAAFFALDLDSGMGGASVALRIRVAWTQFITTGAWGVIVILLSELVDLFQTRHDRGEPGDDLLDPS